MTSYDVIDMGQQVMSGLSPVRRQAIARTNADLLSIGRVGTNINWNRNQNTKHFPQENAFENVYRMSALIV